MPGPWFQVALRLRRTPCSHRATASLLSTGSQARLTSSRPPRPSPLRQRLASHKRCPCSDLHAPEGGSPACLGECGVGRASAACQPLAAQRGRVAGVSARSTQKTSPDGRARAPRRHQSQPLPRPLLPASAPALSSWSQDGHCTPGDMAAFWQRGRGRTPNLPTREAALPGQS